MTLDASDVKNIAHLARVAISDSDVADYAENLSNILDFVDQLNRVDTADVVPMAHPLDMAQRMRPDKVTESNQRELYQVVAPKAEDGLYLVPKVID